MKNELKIKQYCDINGYSFKTFQHTAIITTGLDSWKLEFGDTFNKKDKTWAPIIKVRHQNKLGNKSGKSHFHTQRIAYDLDYVFNKIIIPHESKGRVFQKAFNIKDLIECNV